EEKEEDSQIKNSKFRNISQLGIAQKETETIVLNPETLDLDSYYLLLKRNLRYLPTDKETGENIKQKLFERLFIRYEHKDSPFYLYATSEALQTNINMLLDSELGKLFDTKNAKNVLDVQEIVNQRKLVYVS
ncbi:TPA: type VI secretion protein, partial [Enterococcus faecalis]